MASENDSDPFERYFRPRPGGEEESGPPEDAAPDGVGVEERRAPRVPVAPSRRSERAGARLARRRRTALLIAATMSLVVLFTAGAAWAFQGYFLGKVERVDAFSGVRNRPPAGPQGAMTILLAGVDRREGLTARQIHELHLGRDEGERSDTMMLLHLSSHHDKVTVISLPRDSLVTIPAHRSNGSEGARGSAVPDRPGKLTWAYQYGGPSLTVETIERATGLRISHYVEVNFLGFLKMVDALGGVTVCSPQPVNDPKSGLQIPAGKSHLNGARALAFARARYTLTGGSDLGRIDRQQQFLAALMHQALSTSTLADPVKFTRFLNAATAAVRLDKGLTKSAVTGLAEQMRSVTTDDVTFATVPLANQNYMVPINGSQPQSTVLWDHHAATALFQEIKADRSLVATQPTASPSPTPSGGRDALTVPPRQIGVRVLNGVGTPGLAARSARDLRKAGFTATVVPGTAATGMTRTVIEYGPGRADSAKTLKAAIPGAKLKRVPSLGDRIQVIVGSSWSGARRVVISPSLAASTGGQAQQVKARTATQSICK